MTDPLKLAAWADDPQGRFDPAPVERRLIAAALRLAEAVTKCDDLWSRVCEAIDRDHSGRGGSLAEMRSFRAHKAESKIREEALAAYRAAREGS